MSIVPCDAHGKQFRHFFDKRNSAFNVHADGSHLVQSVFRQSSQCNTHDFKNEYISLTDIARYRSTDPRFTVHSWLRSRDIVEFLGLWEVLHNPDFKRVDFDTFKEDAHMQSWAASIIK